jgi:LytS/YehU family sensor histidine kinase
VAGLGMSLSLLLPFHRHNLKNFLKARIETTMVAVDALFSLLSTWTGVVTESRIFNVTHKT